MGKIADRTRLSSWGGTAVHAIAGRITETSFVPGPDLDPRYAFSIRFDQRDGEAPYSASTSERCELQSSFPAGSANDGDTIWGSWWEYFDPAFPDLGGDRWYICHQWHASVNQPALVMGVINLLRRCERNPTGTGSPTYSPTAPLSRGQWVFHKMGCKISSGTDGWVHWKRNGVTIWNPTGIKTLPTGSSGFYPKIGQYRNITKNGAAVVYFCGVEYWDTEPPDPLGDTGTPPPTGGAAHTWATTGTSRFGASDGGTAWFDIGANSSRGSSFTLGAAAKRTNSVIAWIDGNAAGASGTQPLRVVVYDDVTKARLGVSNEVVITAGAAAAEVTFTFPAYIDFTASRAYRFHLLGGGTAAVARYSYQIAPIMLLNLEYAPDSYADSALDPWAPTVSQTDRKLAIHAVISDPPGGEFPFNTGTILYDEPFDYVAGSLPGASGSTWSQPVVTGDGGWRVTTDEGGTYIAPDVTTPPAWRGAASAYNPTDGDGDYVFHLPALPQAISNQFFGHICAKKQGDSGSASGITTYGINLEVAAGPIVKLGISEFANGAGSSLFARTTVAGVTAGPLWVGLRKNGTSLSLRYSTDGTTWTEHATATDASLTGGRIMVESNSGLTRVSRITHRALSAITPPANLPPTTNFTYSPVDPQVGQIVTFTSSAADPDGSISLYEWDLDGNGSFEISGAGSNVVTKTYTGAGDVLVKHRATDNSGTLGTTTSKVVVVLPGPPPIDETPPDTTPPPTYPPPSPEWAIARGLRRVTGKGR